MNNCFEFNLFTISIVTLIIAILVLIASVAFLFFKTSRQIKLHLNAFKKQLEFYLVQGKSKEKLYSMLKQYEVVLKRAYSINRTFENYQIMTKVFGSSSLIFSAYTLIDSSEYWDKIGSQICTLISIVSVIVILYINPLDRARGYLSAWRKWNTYIASILSAFAISIEACEKQLEKYPEHIASDKNDLSVDEI